MASVHSDNNPLGKSSNYIDSYDATLLFPISRGESWKASGIERDALPFFGEDIWNGYEISWLNDKGIPQVAMAEFRLPATSPFLIESKSFKLYLNSYNQTRFANKETVEQRMVRDLSAAAGGEVKVAILPLTHSFPAEPKAFCIDGLDISMDKYELDPTVLVLAEGDEAGEFQGTLVSHLLKSTCPSISST